MISRNTSACRYPSMRTCNVSARRNVLLRPFTPRATCPTGRAAGQGRPRLGGHGRPGERRARLERAARLVVPAPANRGRAGGVPWRGRERARADRRGAVAWRSGPRTPRPQNRVRRPTGLRQRRPSSRRRAVARSGRNAGRFQPLLARRTHRWRRRSARRRFPRALLDGGPDRVPVGVPEVVHGAVPGPHIEQKSAVLK
jgi:hypothetical protein